ncbi:MAG: inositol monophosphatase family protein [Thermodesulfobacteriota bacterium]
MNYLEVAENTARKAGVVLLENLGKVKEIEFKAKNSLVTEVDKLSEKIIIEDIKKNFPSHSIFAEESGRDTQNSEHLWLIDPIDGTTNYAHAYPFFSISIALEINGVVVAGLVYDPVKDEMFTAELGKGAFLNGEPIKVSKSHAIEHSHVCTGFMHEVEWMVEVNIRHFGNFIRKARAVRRDGSAALDVCYVACGRFDGFWELGLNPWDTAAAVLILKEAGGHVTTFSGGDYTIYMKEILGSNAIVHDQMIEILALED